MYRWLQISLLLVVLGFSKAHHFIRLVVLAAIGLAGLWMIHTLAQDFNNIQTANSGYGGAGGGTRFLFKRSATGMNSTNPELDWEFILSRDPASCARSFICQLSAGKEVDLDATGKLILRFSRYSASKNSWSSRELQQALRNGEQVKHPLQCMKFYKLCPYTSTTMLFLLKVLGR